MYFRIIQGVVVLLQIVFPPAITDPLTSTNNFAFPPTNSRCFFASGEFVFEDRAMQVAPSATFQGAGKLESVYAYDGSQTRSLWGAVYYISNDDEQRFLSQSMMVSDVTVVIQTDPQNVESMDCVTLDVGVLPHAFPFSIYAAFPQDIPLVDYLNRLNQINVPQDYIAWLETLPASIEGYPAPAYLAPPGFVVPAVQPSPPPLHLGHGPAIQPYQISADKVCVFGTGDLIFQELMTAVAPSASLIGAGRLWDKYVRLGGQTEPGKFVKYEGFDNIWGAAYAIDRTDLPNFVIFGEQFFFQTDVLTIVKGLYQVNCLTVDIGLLPSGFPFQVFKDSQLDVQSYLRRLTDLGVPSRYVYALETLAASVQSAR